MDYYIKQNTNEDCGFACLKMLLANLSKNKEFLYMKSPKRQGPYTFFELLEIAKANGLILKAFEIDNLDEIYSFKMPILASLKTGSSISHLVMINKIEKGKVQVFDPELGKSYMEIERLNSLFDGYIIEVQEENIISFKSEKRNFVSLKDNLILILIKVIATLSIFTGLYFINENSYFVAPVGLFLIYALSEVLFQMYVKKVMRSFDERYIEGVYDKNQTIFKEKYIFYSNFKVKKIFSPAQTIVSFITTLFLLIILLINSYTNVYFIIISVAFSLINILLVNPLIERKKTNLQIAENKTLNQKISKDEAVSSLLDINQDALYIVKLVSFQKYIKVMLSLIISLLLMIFSKLMSVNFVVFYFFLYYYLISQEIETINMIKFLKDEKADETKFIDQFL